MVPFGLAQGKLVAGCGAGGFVVESGYDEMKVLRVFE